MGTVPPLGREIKNALNQQGYSLRRGVFALRSRGRDFLRSAHNLAKQERIAAQKDFILRNRGLVQKRMIDGAKLSVEKISPTLRSVTPSSEEAILYRWWNHVWWSLPYEQAYGRQMRYLVWDEHHDAPMGLIGLQSPILSWAPRDRRLNIPREGRDNWINQSMSIQRLGALPPYNQILGGKLTAMMAASDTLRIDFGKKYEGRMTEMQERIIAPRLLFATTTGAFGKSSIYNRLKSRDGGALAEYIGDSIGAGSFHIPNETYLGILKFLEAEGVNTRRGYGAGPSRKMRLISEGMSRLGYKNGNRHGIRRAIYLFSYAKNLEKLIAGENTKTRWFKRDESDLAEFWKERWALPRAERVDRKFKSGEFVAEQLRQWRICHDG